MTKHPPRQTALDFKNLALAAHTKISPSTPEHRLIFGYSSITSKAVSCQIPLTSPTSSEPKLILSLFHKQYPSGLEYVDAYYISGGTSTSKEITYSSPEQLLDELCSFVGGTQEAPQLDTAQGADDSPRQPDLMLTILAARELLRNLMPPLHHLELKEHIRSNILIYLNGFIYQAHDFDSIELPQLEMLTLEEDPSTPLIPFSQQKKEDALQMIDNVIELFDSLAIYDREYSKLAIFFTDMHQLVQKQYHPHSNT